MLVDRKDREEIGSKLYDMSSDSRATKADPTIRWNNPPTPIITPANPPKRSGHDSPVYSRRREGNPFSARRTRTTLAPVTANGKRPPSTGKDNRDLRHLSISTASPSTCARKKIKVGDSNKGKPSLAPESINVDQERRELSSPDPLTISGPHRHGIPLVNEKDSEIDLDDTPQLSGSCAVASTSRLAEDGPATKSLQQELRNKHRASPIEEFEDDPPSCSRVRTAVLEFEKKTKGNDIPPHLDLRMKTKMKPRQALDPVATAPSQFYQKGQRRLIIAPDEPYRLPIKECYIGSQLLPDNYFRDPLYFTWKPNGDRVDISHQHDKCIATLHTGDMQEAEYSEAMTPLASHESMPIFVVSMSKIVFPQSRELSSRPASGEVTIMFDATDNNWKPALYKSLLDWLRKQGVKPGLSRSGRQMWEMAALVSNQDQDPEGASDAVEKLTSLAPDARQTSEARSHDLPSTGKSDAGSDQPFQPRRSARVITIKKPRLQLNPDEVILVYPQGVPGAINITNADVGRLQPGEFLNDTIIEFGLKLWHKEIETSNPNFAKDIHVFSSFFYKKLNRRNFEEGYQSVQKWTSKINLFNKKYIIVPINEHLHWYLAIIYMPQYILEPPPPKPIKQTRSQTRSSRVIKETKDNPSDAVAVPEVQDQNELDEIRRSCTVTVVEDSGLNDTCMSMDVSPDRQEHCERPQLTDECPMDVDKSEEDAVQAQLQPSSPLPVLSETDSSPGDGIDDKTAIPRERKTRISRFFSTDVKASAIDPDTQGQQKSGVGQEWGSQEEDADEQATEDEDQVDSSGFSSKTYIFTLDSLGTSHAQATRQLNRYLKMEASQKLNIVDTSNAIFKAVSVPVQPNFCDCGIYLLHFAQTFMSDPGKYFQLISESKVSPAASDRKAIWQEHKVGTMRQELTDRIKELSEEWKKSRAANKEVKGDQTDTVSDSDSEIEYVETSRGPTLGKTRTPKGSAKKQKTSRLRG